MPHTKLSDNTVVIIGAGPAGLVTARWALAQGLTPLILESAPDIGGQWHPQYGTIWENMHTNLSKHSCMFSDLLWNDYAEMFPSREEVFGYLADYSRAFQLKEYIKFNSSVTGIKRIDDSWHVTYKSKDNQAPHYSLDSKFIIVASGFFTKPYFPAIQGIELYKQAPSKTILHSSEINNTTNDKFSGKKVVIIGGSFSAAELAGRISRAGAASITHIFTKPHWHLTREIPGANKVPLPLDWVFYTRSNRKTADEIKFKSDAANKATNQYMASICAKQNTNPDNPLYLDPDSTNPAYVSISDNYMFLVADGQLNPIRGSIQSFTTDGILLAGHSVPLQADVVVFATGFGPNLDLLDDDTRNTLQYAAQDRLQPLLLSDGITHPALPNLGFVGMMRGPYFSYMELQARYLTMLFSGKLPTPTIEEQQQQISAEAKIRDLNPRPQFPHGDYVGYCDSLARKIGCLPNFTDLQTQNPQLHNAVWHGPVLPTQYRLVGPDAKPTLFNNQFAQVRRSLQYLDPTHPIFPKPSLLWRYRIPIAVTVAAVGIFAAQNFAKHARPQPGV